MVVVSTVSDVVGMPFERLWKIQRQKSSVLRDPIVLLTGSAAGFVGRAAALSFDNGGAKGTMQTLQRRAPQFGILMWLYVPISSQLLPGTETSPPFKALTTFLIGAFSGFMMRLMYNPVGRVWDECLRTGNGVAKTCQIFRSQTILQFYYTTPPLMANALYFGTLLTVFEGLRRFSERNGLLPLQIEEKENHREVSRLRNYPIVVVGHTVLGGLAAAVASTVCYPFSAHCYQQTVIHDSAICRGLESTLRKEVPMIAVSFGVFSMLQHVLARHHGLRAGFGY
uniref:Uncharacterized protein TCIL3000_6_3110 n=1 Tax=Trypanosoma congolense (strain IL3000) TaxID=1068625 RepID=G0UNV0_TRYCI|nr:unnamed protein product [Trypanosoma congolense IL3000]